ncbi:hypothetical protein A3A39_02990 [Candidatus Kaiserbacteria bacterium RIFCSPLOWO2_01_FULL_54_13]|uniref:Aminotransferase n=1 Tax=Candidatus Kaiserbacteria bacterium RIFCSPLOWO2_01_FULL_54_13 TaxID=1798512 RepID=A0A1F6F2G7_9BACT|nr:MAG: hypothetical protein A3A39_02990 [Candidatus Kaiserbacteria bacterium RIFCSPLOWO2_01_FULL_54_13]
MTRMTIPWWQPKVEKGDYRFIQRALDRNFVNEGPQAREFEERIAKLVGARYAVSATSCTAAIFLALKAAGVKAGDEVLVPDMTFIATAHAVDLLGAKVVLVDVDPQTLNIDPSKIARAITKRTRAIIPVHVTGRAADMNAITQIAKKHRLAVIEDAAEAFMSKYGKRFLGTIGDAGCFSFSPNKTISTGQGGVIVTSSKKIYEALKPLKDQGRPQRGTGGDDVHFSVGYNFKLTDLQAGAGLGQLKHLSKRLKRMKRNYALYAKHLKGIGDIRVFPSRKGEVPQWTDIETRKRDELEKYLRSKGIDSRKYWHPIHRQRAYRQSDNKFPASTRLSYRALWLPSAFTLSDADIHTVCRAIKDFFKNAR